MKKILWLCLTIGIHFGIAAQSGMITGRVVDQSGETLPGVNILKVGTSQGTITDLDGNFSIEGKVGDEFKFSFIGFKTQLVKAGSNLRLDIVMLDEIELIK
jgi:TonB-dependent starch-binding outer membrane protein SusC